jgi:hypothetical protein
MEMRAVNFILSDQNNIFMKRIVLVLLTLYNSCICYSQYTVTKVIGHVINQTSGQILYPGSKLRDDDMLAFSSANDMLRVIVSGKGIYVISPGPRSEVQQSAIVDMLKSALKIKAREGYLSSRSEEDELIPAVLQTDASINTNNLLRTENKYLFDPRNYPVSNGNRFFLQTEVMGSPPVIRPLKTLADTLFLYASDVQTNNAVYKLGFFSKEKNSSQLLAEIKPLMDSTLAMETIIQLIVDENKQTDKSVLKRACYTEVYEAIGKPSALLFNRAFDKIVSAHSKKAN